MNHGIPEAKVEFHDVGGDDYAYGALLSMLWSSGDTFCLIEHDIKVGPTTLRDFYDCPNGYCAAPYAWTTTIGVALGCTRFRKEFTAAYPDAMREACETPSAWTGQPGYWRQLDVFLMRRILRDKHGEQPCGHLPPVEHLNEGQALVAGASDVPVLTVEGF